MRALVLHRPVADAGAVAPFSLESVPDPVAKAGQVVVRVTVCSVCRTDLDLAEGRLAAPRYPVIPGHQVVGRIVAVGAGVTTVREGDRVGIAWINSACGECRWCTAGEENLCPYFQSTGCDVNGGYAELVAAPASFVYPIPDAISDNEAAPLLCAGAIGWRSLRLTEMRDGDTLGLIGFGASAHIVLQIARFKFPHSPVYVLARDAAERTFASELGAAWTGDSADAPPGVMHAAIDTTPAWKPMIDALPHLAPGGRLVVNAIRKGKSDQRELERLDYATHLWMEREIKSVANVTRADVREMLAAAAAMGLRPTVTSAALADGNEVLAEIRRGSIRGATVLRPS